MHKGYNSDPEYWESTPICRNWIITEHHHLGLAYTATSVFRRNRPYSRYLERTVLSLLAITTSRIRSPPPPESRTQDKRHIVVIRSRDARGSLQ
jgi:hypothetical protein